MILIFSTARRYHLFQMTLKNLVIQSPNINSLVDSVYVLDDRSTGEDRNKMETDLNHVFDDGKVKLICFSNNEKYGWIDKLNFISKIAIDAEYIFFIEDDWEFHKPLELVKHLQFLNLNDDIDLITFNGSFSIQNTDEKEKWDYVESYNDTYYANPYPNGIRNITSEKEGIQYWVGVSIDNFSLNPGLFRSDIFLNNTFSTEIRWEVDFLEGKGYKQLFLKNGNCYHRGNDETLIEGRQII
tara:strand:- start:263 stop:985 length:723 start_codon:yes stop_codon:yes gene_type:complete